MCRFIRTQFGCQALAGRLSAETWSSAFPCPPMRITFCELHDASRPTSLQMTDGGPPVTAKFLSFPSAKNAMYQLSADQTRRAGSTTSVPAGVGSQRNQARAPRLIVCLRRSP